MPLFSLTLFYFVFDRAEAALNSYRRISLPCMIILCMSPANVRRRYIVTPSLIGCAHTEWSLTSERSYATGLPHDYTNCQWCKREEFMWNPPASKQTWTKSMNTIPWICCIWDMIPLSVWSHVRFAWNPHGLLYLYWQRLNKGYHMDTTVVWCVERKSWGRPVVKLPQTATVRNMNLILAGRAAQVDGGVSIETVKRLQRHVTILFSAPKTAVSTVVHVTVA